MPCARFITVRAPSRVSMSLASFTCLFLLLAPRSTSCHAVIAAGSPSFRGGFSEEDHEPVDAADDEPLIRGRIELVSTSTPNAATLTLLPPKCRHSHGCAQITGPMFSGKSTELIRRYSHALPSTSCHLLTHDLLPTHQAEPLPGRQGAAAADQIRRR